MKYITIYSLKYDNSISYEWETRIIDQNNNYIVTFSEPGRVIKHHIRNKLYHFDSWSIDYIEFGKWFTVSKSLNRLNEVEYYCNICMPPILENNKISFIDLDLDYLCKNGLWKVVDQDEFEEHQILYKYPKDIINRAKTELNNLIYNIDNNITPFDGTLDSYFGKYINF